MTYGGLPDMPDHNKPSIIAGNAEDQRYQPSKLWLFIGGSNTGFPLAAQQSVPVKADLSLCKCVIWLYTASIRWYSNDATPNIKWSTGWGVRWMLASQVPVRFGGPTGSAKLLLFLDQLAMQLLQPGIASKCRGRRVQQDTCQCVFLILQMG